MTERKCAVGFALWAMRAISLLAFGSGCQSGQQVLGRRLIEHQAMIDFSGLEPEHRDMSVKAVIGTPYHWEFMPITRTPFYTHEQWRSPSTHTAVGILHATLPLPLSADAVVWLARREYSRKENDGKVLGQWTDSLGRAWFEGENDRYHARGYVVVKGFDAWFVYCGYRIKYPPDLAEISVAARSLETVVPMFDGSAVPSTQPARQ